MMAAGGDHGVPISRQSTTSSASRETIEGAPASHAFDSFPAHENDTIRQAHQHMVVDEAQGRYRNAGLSKGTNHVKFSAERLEPKENFDGVQIELLLGEQASDLLPERPLPTANIPHAQEKGSVGSQRRFPVNQRSFTASADVNGLSISRSIAGSNDINLSLDDKGMEMSAVQMKSRSPRSSQVSSLSSTSIEAVFQTKDGNEVPMFHCLEKRQLFDDIDPGDNEAGLIAWQSTPHTYEAQQIAHQMSRPNLNFLARVHAPSPGSSGQVTPSEDLDSESYAERPDHYRRGILSSILRLYDQQNGGHYFHDQGQGRYDHSRQGSTSDESGRGSSADDDTVWKSNRPRKWYEKSSNQSRTSLSGSTKNPSPISMVKRSRSSSAIGSVSRLSAKPRLEDEIRVTVHIAELLSRQRYLIRLCRALMKYGAPTHRLEEYMRMTARVLEIESSFLYIPGCMIVSFDDASTHTTEVRVVRSSQGIDLGKLADVHEIYKEVIHDVIGVEEATKRLEATMKKRNKFHVLFLIFAHGCASASVGPFAFNARPVDMPVAFLLGCLLGVLQLVLSPKSNLYSNVFEISAAVLTSFLARAFGSIRFQGEPLFCFSALAQAAIALILPGYTVLCASLELQSRSIVAGSVRMVYAIIYSLFLGFGITIGTAVYGLLDSQATTAYTCPASPINNEYLQRFPFVLLFTACLAIVNHAKWKQIPMMMIISLAGYVVSYFSSKRFYSNTQVSNALGAFVIGVIGNCYSRLRHGLAAAAMLPAIFVLVPSGLAASGSLISGITAAEEMTKNPYTVVANGTQGFVEVAKNLSAADARNQNYGVVFDIGYGMVQIAIGTTVGLFLAALIVYPLGKKRSGLFSF